MPAPKVAADLFSLKALLICPVGAHIDVKKKAY
jgi:hypothetical protein